MAGSAFVFRGVFCPGDFFPRVFCPWALLAGGTFGQGDSCPGVLLSGPQGGLLPGGTFARSPQVQGVYEPSRLSVPSIVYSVTDKQKDKFGPVAPRGVDRAPAPQIFRVCRGGGTLHISSKHYMGPTPFYGARGLGPKKPKSRFCHEANEYMSP